MSPFLPLALCTVLPLASPAGEQASLKTHTLFTQNFDSAKGEKPPWPIRDNSGWAGSRVPMRVVDSGDARHGRVLECEVSGFCQIILGSMRGIKKGTIYRVSADISSKGMLRPTVLLRKGRSGYTVYLSSEEVVNESMREVSFIGRSLHDGSDTVLLMLIMNGVTTLHIDNLKVEEVIGDLPPGAPPRPGNLVLNYGFELLWDGWFVRREAEFPAIDDAAEGQRVAELRSNAIISSSWLKLSRESDYFVQARVRSRGPRAKVRLSMSNYIFPRGGSAGKAQVSEVRGEEGWKTIGFRWRPPSSGKITKWAEYFVQVHSVGADSVAQVDAVEVKADLPHAGPEPLELAVFTDAPQNVITEGEAVQLTVMATADAPTAKLEIRDESDGILRSVPLTFAGREAKVRLTGQPCGYWRLTTVRTGKQTQNRIEAETFLAVVPAMPAVPISDWMYGCHVTRSEPIRKACWKLGLRWDRFHDTCKTTKWRMVQPEKGQWIFSDEIIAQHQAEGHALIGSLATLPGWVPRVDREGQPIVGKHTRGNRGMVAETFPLWAEYARRCAEHWKGTIDVWEVTNEPNLSGMSPADYLKILKSAYQGVKAGNRDAVVIGLGGATPAGNPWILEAIKLGAPRYADALSFHGYGSTTWSCTVGPHKLISLVGRIREALREAGASNLPLWDSECGVSVRTSFTKFLVPHGGDPTEAARMFPKSAAAIRAAGIQRVLYYSAHATTHAGDSGLRWLCDFNGVVKKPAVPLAVAISLLEGTQYVGMDSDSERRGIVALEFRGSDGSTHMMWAIRGKIDTTLPKGARRVVNMWGRELRLTGSAVRLTDEPIYVQSTTTPR